MKVQKGDLIGLALNGHFDVIVHGCNCFCTMGAGIAKQIKSLFPEAYQADKATRLGDRNKLGTYSCAAINMSHSAFTVINAYTQFDHSGTGVLVDYDAVRKIFARIKKKFPNKKIAYPKIGAGLAKGDWEVISSIIDQELAGENHTLIEYIQTDND